MKSVDMSFPHRVLLKLSINQSNQIYIAPYVASESEARYLQTTEAASIRENTNA